MNDLWFLVSSYEDIGITVYDLAKFLIANGFDARPEGSHVMVKLSGGGKVYLTPNGGASGLADLWKNPLDESNEPIRVNYAPVKKNATYHRSYNPDFIKSVSRTVGFPVAPLGECKEGSEQIGRTYNELGYNVTYMYTPNNPGHEWTLIEDDSLEQMARGGQLLRHGRILGMQIYLEQTSAKPTFPGP